MTPAATSGPTCRETVQLLACEGERLLAVLAEPNGPAIGDLGVVIVVGGPQYRAGSHRQFVQLARTLAAAGTPTLRFDVRGMGDSTGAQRNFEELTADTGAAIGALLSAQPRLKRVALWGLCDGASAALLYLHEHADPRVVALCLLNPWVRSEASLARTHVKHYYRQRLMQREFWLKLASGRVAGAAVRSLWGNLKAARAQTPAAGQAGERGQAAAADYQTRMAQAWQRFGGPVLLVLSGQDYTAREFTEFVGASPAWHGALSRANVQRHDMAQADHTFSAQADARQLAQDTLTWLARCTTT
jgi:exosortase A-associated hydrolase 1